MPPMKKIIYFLAITALGTLAGCIKVSDETLACKKPATPAATQAVYDANTGENFTLALNNYSSSYNYTLVFPNGTRQSTPTNPYPFSFTLNTGRAGIYKVIAQTKELTPCVSDTGYFTINVTTNTGVCPLPINQFVSNGSAPITLSTGTGTPYTGYYRMRWTLPSGQNFTLRFGLGAPSTSSPRTYTVVSKSTATNLLAGECSAAYTYNGTDYFAYTGTVDVAYVPSLGQYRASFCDIYQNNFSGVFKGYIYCNQ